VEVRASVAGASGVTVTVPPPPVRLSVRVVGVETETFWPLVPVTHRRRVTLRRRGTRDRGNGGGADRADEDIAEVHVGDLGRAQAIENVGRAADVHRRRVTLRRRGTRDRGNGGGADRADEDIAEVHVFAPGVS